MRICPRNAPLYGGEPCDEATADAWCRSMRDQKWCYGCERDTFKREENAKNAQSNVEQRRLF
jgi:hypothetical protein